MAGLLLLPHACWVISTAVAGTNDQLGSWADLAQAAMLWLSMPKVRWLCPAALTLTPARLRLPAHTNSTSTNAVLLT